MLLYVSASAENLSAPRQRRGRGRGRTRPNTATWPCKTFGPLLRLSCRPSPLSPVLSIYDASPTRLLSPVRDDWNYRSACLEGVKNCGDGGGIGGSDPSPLLCLLSRTGAAETAATPRRGSVCRAGLEQLRRWVKLTTAPSAPGIAPRLRRRRRRPILSALLDRLPLLLFLCLNCGDWECSWQGPLNRCLVQWADPEQLERSEWTEPAITTTPGTKEIEPEAVKTANTSTRPDCEGGASRDALLTLKEAVLMSSMLTQSVDTRKKNQDTTLQVLIHLQLVTQCIASFGEDLRQCYCVPRSQLTVDVKSLVGGDVAVIREPVAVTLQPLHCSTTSSYIDWILWAPFRFQRPTLEGSCLGGVSPGQGPFDEACMIFSDHLRAQRLWTGRKTSAARKDRDFFEGLYNFSSYVAYVAFRQRNLKEIQREVGRLLRTNIFNSALREKTKAKRMIRTDVSLELKSPPPYRMLMGNRQPAIRSVLDKRSPVLSTLLPMAKDSAQYLFQDHYLHPNRTAQISCPEDLPALSSIVTESKIGIIGSPRNKFSPHSLLPLHTEEQEEEEEEEEQEQEDPLIEREVLHSAKYSQSRASCSCEVLSRATTEGDYADSTQ